MQLADRDNEIFYNMLKWFNKHAPDKMDRFIESISANQVEGKKWLIEELDKVQIPRDDEGKFKIEIVGGWFGFPLVDLLTLKYGDEIRGIDYFDIDPFAARIFGVYLSMWDIDIQAVRIFTKGNSPTIEGDYFKYKNKRRAHLIINTSCEHMQDMKNEKYKYFEPERTLLVLQSNNKTDEEDHINCVEGEEELAKKNGIRMLGGGWKTMKSKLEEGESRKNIRDEKGQAHKFEHISKRLIKDGDYVYYNRYMALGRWE